MLECDGLFAFRVRGKDGLSWDPSTDSTKCLNLVLPTGPIMVGRGAKEEGDFT